jgi:hypothetical protein
MRLLKLGLISAVVLFVVVFGISLLIPAHVRISRAVNIQAPKDSIVGMIAHIPSWKQWNHMVSSQDLTNASYADSMLLSDQLQVRRQLPGGDTVKTTWRQKSGREAESTFAFHTKGEITVVQWYFDFYLRWYPWEKFGSIVFDKQLGPPMEKSLANLKKMLENPR